MISRIYCLRKHYKSIAATMADANPTKHMPVRTLCSLPHFSTRSFVLASSSGVYRNPGFSSINSSLVSWMQSLVYGPKAPMHAKGTHQSGFLVAYIAPPMSAFRNRPNGLINAADGGQTCCQLARQYAPVSSLREGHSTKDMYAVKPLAIPTPNSEAASKNLPIESLLDITDFFCISMYWTS